MAEWGSQARRAPPRAAAKTLKTPRRRRRGREGGGGDGDAGEGRGAAVDKEVRGGGAVPAAVPEGVDAAGGEGGGGRLPRQPEAGVQVGGGRLRPPDAAELALPPGAQGQALPLCLSIIISGSRFGPWDAAVPHVVRSDDGSRIWEGNKSCEMLADMNMIVRCGLGANVNFFSCKNFSPRPGSA